jgi:hypothetical protein
MFAAELVQLLLITVEESDYSKNSPTSGANNSHSGPDKINVSTLDVGANQLHLQPVADIEAMCLLKQSLDPGIQNANEGSVFGHAGHNSVEDLAYTITHRDSRHALGHFAFDFVGGILFEGAVAGDGLQLAI